MLWTPVTSILIIRLSFMRILTLIFLVFITNIGYSQNSNNNVIIGSWTLISSKLIHPTICSPFRDPTDYTGQQFGFYKHNIFILSPLKKHEEGIMTGIWKINNENNLIIRIDDQIIKLKIRFRNGKLYLSNTLVGLEFERT